MMRPASILHCVFVAVFVLSLDVREALPQSVKSKAAQAKAILKKHCHVCHGEDGAIEGGLNYILDSRSLVSRRQVIPKQPSKSPLWRRIESEEMPPEDASTELSKDEAKIINEWIREGALPFEAQAKRTLIDDRRVFDWIAADLKSIKAADRKYVRYFSIAPLYNQNLSSDELQSYRHGLSKLVNSLSWNAKITVPQSVDPDKTLMRINLRDYAWKWDIWQQIIDRYPYGVVLDSAVARQVYQDTTTPIPVIRADWFVAVAARPPLYHDILDLPRRDWLLEKQLGINVELNIAEIRVARAGFNGSGVSRNNRMIERHASKHGAYWKSYDFAGNNGQQNLFAHPLGPEGDQPFQHAGGEIIFNLPNGLQAYFLTDHRGRRIDKGPTEIVSDPKRPDRAVVNGLSCMSCHARGIIFKSDQIRPHVVNNKAAFKESVHGRILQLYPPQEEFQKLLKQDAERFRIAVAKTGAQLGSTEPVVALALRFERELDLAAGAAEAGVTPAVFQNGLKKFPLLARKLGALNVPGGSVQREVYVEGFADVVRELKLGKVRDHSGPARRFGYLGGHLDFSNDGKLLAAVDEDHKIRIWNAQTTEEIQVTEEHSVRVRDIEFSRDGKLLVSACEDSIVRLFSVETGKLLHELRGHTGIVFSAAFLPDGKSVVSGGMDATVRQWNVSSGKLMREFNGHKGWIRSVVVGDNGLAFSSGNDGQLIGWDLKSGKIVHALQVHKQVVTDVQLVPNSTSVVTGAYDNTVRVWNLQSWQPHLTLIGHTKPIRGISVAPNGRWLATVAADALRIWDLKTGGEVHRIVPSFGAVKFSRDSRRLATSGGTETVQILGLPELDEILRNERVAKKLDTTTAK